MNLGDVALLFTRRGVPSGLYSLAGGLPNEAFAIERVGEVWRVYYSERGHRNVIGEFVAEADACAVLVCEVLRYAFGEGTLEPAPS